MKYAFSYNITSTLHSVIFGRSFFGNKNTYGKHDCDANIDNNTARNNTNDYNNVKNVIIIRASLIVV